MASPWKSDQPDVVADKILRRAEVGKIGRRLKARLALAQFKTARGWEDLTLDSIEPKVEEELRRRRPMSSGDIVSDSSSSTSSELRYPSARYPMSSPLKAPALFSDQMGPRSGSGSSSGHRKRNYHAGLTHPSSSDASSRKRFRSSPNAGRYADATWKGHHQLAQSSPLRGRKQAHFTTSSGPGLAFYGGAHENFAAASDEEEDTLPVHSFNLRSSPPRTPPPVRSRSLGRRNKDRNGNGTGPGKSGEEGADLLLYLATSPSPANPRPNRMQTPSTPPPKSMALPSSMMNTPGGGSGLLSVFGGPHTPSQAFDFSDFVNITPSPAQNGFPKTPRTIKTPLTVARRRLTFENFVPSNANPNLGDHPPKNTGLGMQLGGDLIS